MQWSAVPWQKGGGIGHLSAEDNPPLFPSPPMGSAGVTDTLALPPFVHPVCSSKQSQLINSFPQSEVKRKKQEPLMKIFIKLALLMKNLN